VELYLHSHNTPSWLGAQLKYRDNFTSTFKKGEVEKVWRGVHKEQFRNLCSSLDIKVEAKFSLYLIKYHSMKA
jgi:hypothetical protein